MNQDPFSVQKSYGVTTLVSKENGTQLTFQGQYETKGIIKWMEGIIGKRIQKQDASNIHTMKQLLESGA